MGMKLFYALLMVSALVRLMQAESAGYEDSDEVEEEDCMLDRPLCKLKPNIDCEQQLRDKNYANLVYCNAMHCEPESFEHDYLVRNHDQTPHINHWKRARIGDSATLHDICLLRNGLPVTRRCRLNNLTAEWEPIDRWQPVVCMREFKERSISIALNSLHDEILEGKRHTNNTQERRRATATMRDMFRQRDNTLLPADVHVTGQLIEQLLEEQKDVTVGKDLVSICRDIMSSDAQTLRLSAQLNATDSLLQQFEHYMDALPQQLVPQANCGKVAVQAATDFEVESVNLANIGVQAYLSSNLSVFFVNPQCQRITGIAVYSAAAADRQASKSGFWYRLLYAHENLDKLRVEAQLETAAYLPDSLWRQLRTARGASHLVFKVYAHDALFVEKVTERRRRPRSKVLSITIPGLKDVYLPEPIPLLLRNENHRRPDARALSSGSGCGYWNYETNSWQSDGVNTKSQTDILKDPIIVCHTQHVTQFSFLVGGSYRTNDLGQEQLITPFDERVLDIISIVGCSLSLFGVLGIYLTAALFKSWRSQASTKVLLHLCLALTLQMLLFVFINTDDISEQLIIKRNYTRCVLLGALLQYTILVLFSWMLIIAFLQFQRYVTVIGIERPKRYILKSALVAWSLPLLPTLLVALIDPQSYLPTRAQLITDTGICYPSGFGLTFGVVLPIALITVTNLVIFVYVFYSISHSLGQVQRAERKMVIKQIRLSVLLFFLLGLSWIFGIFAFMQAGIAFSYLFCLTATLQGFVLFVYFVLLDENNRRAWRALLWPTKQHMDVHKRTTELQSMTTTSTNYSAGTQQ